MKKVMIGILVLIPVIILLVVALVSAIVSTAAHIGVEDITLALKKDNANNILELKLSDDIYNLNNFLNVVIAPAKATNRNVRWSIEEMVFLDTEYETKYKEYIKNKDDPDYVGEFVADGAEFVNDKNEQIRDSSTGKIKINAYCYFYVKAQAEQKSARMLVYVGGFDVKSALIKGTSSVAVGDYSLLSAVFNPIDSIVNDTIWASLNPEVATVDQNGLLKGKAKGTAKITVKAKISSHDGNDPDSDYVTSAIFDVTVNDAVSKFGKTLTTHKRELAISDLGLKNPKEGNGYSLTGNAIKILDNVDKVSIEADGGILQIVVCDEKDIVIEGSDIFGFVEAKENNFVLPVGEIKLQLVAQWASMMREGAPNVTWKSSNAAVATVDADGTVTGKQSGFATISSTFGGKSTNIVLSVQTKVTSIILGTSIQSMAVGLARETVFGSRRFENQDGLSDTKVDNFVEIKFARPLIPNDEEEKKLFLSAFTFEVDGANKDKAYFEKDSNILRFYPDKIKGKTSIKVTIKAKYPKYESFNNYTTTIIVTNGVYIYADKPSDGASKADKDAYALSLYRQLRLVEKEMNAEGFNTPYDITLGGNVEVPDSKEGSLGYWWGEGNGFNLKGSIYGNNHMISAGYRNLNGSSALIKMASDNLTVSNVQIRANRLLPGQAEITTPTESKGLTGYALDADSGNRYQTRIKNLRIEYSIIENGSSLFGIFNTDVTVEGSIFRNCSGVAMYAPSRMNRNQEGKLDTIYSHVTVKNCVMSNLLGSSFSAHYEDYSKEKVDGKSVERVGWKAEYDKGFNTTLTQLGFLDLYNWQDIDNASLIQTGTPAIDTLIKDLAGRAIKESDLFKSMRFEHANKVWLHMGAITMGLSGVPWWEDTFFEATFEDKRFMEVRFRELAGINFLGHEFGIYGYRNDIGQGNIIPGEFYTIDNKLIDKLHGIGVA